MRSLYVKNLLLSGILLIFCFSSLYSVLAQEIQAEQVKEQNEYTLLKMRETQLKVSKDELEKGRYKTERIFNLVIPLLKKDKISETEEAFITYWYQQHAQYQENVTQLMLDKQAFLLKKTMRTVSQYIDQLPSKLASKYQKKHNQMIKKFFPPWEEHQKVIAHKDQRHRLYNFYNYFKALQVLINDFNKETHQTKQAYQGKATKPTLWQSIKAVPGLLSSVAKIIYQSNSNSSYRKRIQGQTPTTVAGNELVQKVSKYFGFNITLHGQEYLPPEIDSNQLHAGNKDIYFFFPNHKDGVADVSIIGALNLSHYMIFANASTFMPSRYFASYINEAPEFIPVGPWRDKRRRLPSVKFMDNLKKKVASNIINFPSGFVGDSGEFLPFREDLVEKLIGQAIKKGYRPHIITVSNDLASSFLSPTQAVPDKDINVYISPVIPADALIAMKKLEDRPESPTPKLISTIVSSLWIKNIKVHKELTLSQMQSKINKLIKHLDLSPAGYQNSHCVIN